MAKNTFQRSEIYEHTIVDSKDHVVCTIRIKPSGILWADKHGKIWKGVDLATFSKFMEENGKDQKK